MNNNNLTVGEFSKYEMDEDLRKEDNRNLLPTDDQLDRFVDNLCENLPTLKLEHPPESFGSSTTSDSYESDTNSTSAQSFMHQHGQVPVCFEKNHIDNVGMKDSFMPHNSFDQSKFITSKRSTPNSNLNIAILQCTRSLELLVERRKNLELLIRRNNYLTNPSYNVSYTPRLPDTPTRVDRLLYDINQERCRILGLMSELEKTISSYSSKSAKEDLRKLLVAYGKAIIDVIKERQNEINSLNGCGIIESGVHKLVELVNEVHRMNRQVHTALWCLEVKEQFNMAMSRRRAVESCSPAVIERKLPETVVLQKSWPATKFAMQGNRSPQSPRMSRALAGNGSGARPGVFAAKTTLHPQTNLLYQVNSPPPVRPKKSAAFQLLAQQQRAEIFQRFSSSLKQLSS